MVRPLHKLKHRPPPKPAEQPQEKETVESQTIKSHAEYAEELAARPAMKREIEQKKEERKEAMGRFQVGQKVHFRPSHAKELQLTGTIKSIDEKNPNSMVVTAQPADNAKAIEVERDFGASAEDATEAE
jgi:hypothetical protein